MRKMLIFIMLIGFLVIGSNAIAEDYTPANATDKCWFKIEDLYPGSDYENPCRATDMGDTWFIVWNMACPFILQDPETGPRRTGAACEVNKKTGKIVYLAVSARELISDSEMCEDNLIAGRGCCSRHGGACGCRNGKVKCCDGTTSPSCKCK